MNLRISTSGLVKSHLSGRRAHPVLMGVDLKWSSGAIHVLRGPNGAGKTTLLKILAGLDVCDAGRVSITDPMEGHQIAADPGVLRKLGAWLPDRPGFSSSLSARHAMEEVLILDGVINKKDRHDRISQAQAVFSLDGLLDRPGPTFSRGQQAQLAIARLSLLNRNYWWLDEPFAALDVEAISRVCAWMESRSKLGDVVVLCTHQVDSGPMLSNKWSIPVQNWSLSGGKVEQGHGENELSVAWGLNVEQGR